MDKTEGAVMSEDKSSLAQQPSALRDALENLLRCGNAIVGADASDPEAAEAFEMYDDARRKARAALEPGNGAVEAKPVGWRRFIYGQWSLSSDKFYSDDEPLYAAPSPAALDPVTVEAIARTIAKTQGHDPDDLAPRTRMCTADNQQVPWWKVFEEEGTAIRALIGQPSVSSTVRAGGEK
jgi:hypothetical protein